MLPIDSTRNQLRLSANPLLATHAVKSVDVAELQAPTIHRHLLRETKRDMRDLRRRQTAAEAIAGLDHVHEIYGFTKGQFGLLQLLEAILERTGPARVSLSTWTAARHEIQTLDRHVKAGRLLSMRWLIDFSFARRDPEAAHQIRQTFGLDAIRVAQNHSKFALIEAEGWELVLRTSMNLNMNPRLEDFTLAHDPALASFLRDVLNDIWTRQKRSLADASGREQRQFFTHEL
ncbi:hypothetical protein Plim_2133 [Planctopirus limnophila DSM 3776]|uniref:Phospholipase D-like domain-containing protein n=1 Tax=Planctopirus limnophila (strain ATCC 43296 / DSM 3776 / IFAM 1008 / Mu 290) TaxID=521674 RepID=D5SMQ5_PLAL2|nr:hypothetical protein [Planctopirus limnophila]ADG67960.1 hypothetical protein Plim_2133 [Planctopirus limnophila DSM 3776]